MVTINPFRNALRPPPATRSPEKPARERPRLLEQQPALMARLDTFVAQPAASPTIPLGTGRAMRASNEFQLPHVKAWPFDRRLWPTTTSQVISGLAVGTGESLAGAKATALPQPFDGHPRAVPVSQAETGAQDPQPGEDSDHGTGDADDQRGSEQASRVAGATVASARTLDTTHPDTTDPHATVVDEAVVGEVVATAADQIAGEVPDQSPGQRAEQQATEGPDQQDEPSRGRVATAVEETVTRFDRRRPAKDAGAVEAVPPALVRPRQATIYAVAQHKGGVGKTTTTINLGAWFGQLGYRTLLVDLDPQGNLAKGLGLTPPAGAMYRVLRDPATPIDSAIVPTGLPNVDILPADTGLEAAEIEMIHAVSRETVLSRKIKAAGLRERYDCILLDCRPSLGVLTVNAMVAADRLIIPVETHFFALEALQTLLDVFETVQENLHPELEIGGIVPTLHEPRVRVCQATLEMLRERYPEWLTRTVIRKFVAYPEAQLRGQPISVLAPGTEAAESYRALALELHGESQSEQVTTYVARREGRNQQLAAPAA